VTPSPAGSLFILAFGDRTLALTAEEFESGLRRGLALTSSTATAPAANGDAHLCTAEQMEASTGVPATWFLEAARAGTVPHHKIGRYVRFRADEVFSFTRFRGRAAPGKQKALGGGLTVTAGGLRDGV
jgi:hypothetical protein